MRGMRRSGTYVTSKSQDFAYVIAQSSNSYHARLGGIVIQLGYPASSHNKYPPGFKRVLRFRAAGTHSVAFRLKIRKRTWTKSYVPRRSSGNGSRIMPWRRVTFLGMDLGAGNLEVSMSKPVSTEVAGR